MGAGKSLVCHFPAPIFLPESFAQRTTGCLPESTNASPERVSQQRRLSNTFGVHRQSTTKPRVRCATRGFVGEVLRAYFYDAKIENVAVKVVGKDLGVNPWLGRPKPTRRSEGVT